MYFEGVTKVKHVMTRKELSAKNIKAVRMRANMSQEQFAEALGVATNTISRIETKVSPVSAEVALKINERFYVCMDYLFGFSSEEEGEPPCSLTCEELLNAQSLIEVQEATIKDLRGKLDAIQDVLNGKISIKLEKPDCPT